MNSLSQYLSEPGRIKIGGSPGGCDALAMSKFLSEKPREDIIFIARDETRMVAMQDLLNFFVHFK